MPPSARNPVVRPSAATPTQLMPAPQVTAPPQGRPWGRPGGVSRPARRTATVSLATSVVVLQPAAVIRPASRSSSSGRSALAMQATVCAATGHPPGRPASRAAAPITAPIASSTGGVGNVRTPGPRPPASSDPSAATRAMSVLLFPPSMARTAGSSAGLALIDPGQEGLVLRDEPVAQAIGQVDLAD